MKEIFESTLERILKDHVSAEAVIACENADWPTAMWSTIEESGFTLAVVPEEFGGTGASWSDVSGLIQLCGQYALPIPLPEAILSNWLLGQCGSEPVAGPLTFGAIADLKLDADGISGSIQQIPWGRHQGHVLALVTNNDGQDVVVLDIAEAAEIIEESNTAGEPRDTLVFKSATPFRSAALVAPLQADVLFKAGAMLRSAQTAGALMALLDMASRYANERSQFGKPIAKFQAIQHQLAVLAEHTMAAKIAALAAFSESDIELASLQIMAAKICSGEAAGIGAGIAHTVHGAIGFTHEYSLHIFTRRLWSWRSEFGSAAYWSQILGKEICRSGPEQLWPSVTRGALPA
ncbi:MAG: acyl-CoA dehydrogenase [Arenicella sp.]|jgi:acyl-CoA dehydrogenase|nr:acyl-CoA dehydrogenase [Arenicella sp.]